MNNDDRCPICLDTYTDPKPLSCRHQFCRECVENCVRNLTLRNIFRCPVCRRVTTVRDISLLIGGLPEPQPRWRQIKDEEFYVQNVEGDFIDVEEYQTMLPDRHIVELGYNGRPPHHSHHYVEQILEQQHGGPTHHHDDRPPHHHGDRPHIHVDRPSHYNSDRSTHFHSDRHSDRPSNYYGDRLHSHIDRSPHHHSDRSTEFHSDRPTHYHGNGPPRRHRYYNSRRRERRPFHPREYPQTHVFITEQEFLPQTREQHTQDHHTDRPMDAPVGFIRYY